MAKEKKRVLRTRGGLWILIVSAVVLEAISCLTYFTSRAAIRHEAEQRAKTELRKAELEIETHTVEMETAAKTLALLAEKYIDRPDSIYSATRLAVRTMNTNTSMAIAFVPGYYPKEGRYFEPCSSRMAKGERLLANGERGDSIYTRNIGSAAHDYTQMEWWQNGFVHDSCWWCEPYLDDSGSKTFVVSCSYPVHDRKGKVVAVVCVDMSLDALKNLSEYLQVYPNSCYSIHSGKGIDIVPAPDTVAGRKYNIYTEEIDATGWHIEIIIPEDDLFKDLNHVGRIVGLLMLTGLALLLFIVIRTGKNFVKLVNLSNEQEHMESELTIARNIQMAMLPTRFPPFEDYPNLNAYGVVIPAKEVGGDLFDFYIRENRLFFCIGDVSGKGVPASLVMAMTRSIFRSFTSYLDSPAQIVSQMNDSLAGEGNQQNMFVTLFLGVLDLATGELRYCNAGHDAPVRIQNSDVRSQNSDGRCQMADGRIQSLPVVANLPLGVMAGFEYAEQQETIGVGDTLFLYTDGLTEAENGAHEQFGMERVMEAVRCQMSDFRIQNSDVRCQKLVEAVIRRVEAFRGDAEQSDDLTLFAIRLLNNHFSLVMRNDIQQIPTLAEWIDTIGLPQEMVMPINLALEEAVSNVMLYAYPGKSGKVIVECEIGERLLAKGERIVFTITDSGIPFDPTQQKEPDITQSAEERPIGGLGIFLVNQIMDEVRYERKENKNVLTLVKAVNG